MKYWIILLLVIIVQIIFAWNTVENDRKSKVTEIENRAKEQIQYLHGMIRDKLQNKEYDSIDMFLQRWGTHNNHIAEITLTTANGFVLSHYQPGSNPTHSFSLTDTILYSYNSTATLSLVVDLESVFRSSSELSIYLVGVISLFSLFLTITTWLYLRQKKLSIDFRNSEEKYRALASESPDLRYRTDKEGKLVFVSQSFHKMTGYTVEEAMGMKMTEFYVNPEERDLFLVALQKDGSVNDFVVQLKRKDGSIGWASVNTQLYKDQDGNILGVDGVVRDVTENKLADDKLIASKMLLDKSQEIAHIGSWSMDFKQGELLWSDEVYRIFGLSPQEFEPTYEAFLKTVHPDDRNMVDHAYQDSLKEKKPYDIVHRIIQPNGEMRVVHEKSDDVLDENGEVIQSYGMVHDITEKIKLEEESLKVRKLESVGILAGGIAHDFNNILTAILGNISLALTLTEPKDETYELLKESVKASLRAKDLILQLLTFAKGGEPVKTIAAIDEVIQDSAGFVLRGSNVRCDFKFGAELWPVAIDTGQISQVIQNIIINAGQAMPTGGTIAIDCSNYCLESSEKIPLSSGNYIKIVVKDQGVGIPADMLDKIFDPYFTTKQKGSGLGLAITHSIISKHGGYITVDSEPGRGTIFTIYLPASQDRSELEQKDVVVTPVTGQGRVMIMDDEEMIRSLVETALSRIGYEVVSAEDGDQAVRLYQEAKEAGAPIDLIIMDLTIPGGLGGKDAVKEIHKIDPETKVIVSSGYSNDPVMANFSEYGFCAAMVKPFQIQELMKFVAKAVSG